MSPFDPSVSMAEMPVDPVDILEAPLEVERRCRPWPCVKVGAPSWSEVGAKVGVPTSTDTCEEVMDDDEEEEEEEVEIDERSELVIRWISCCCLQKSPIRSASRCW